MNLHVSRKVWLFVTTLGILLLFLVFYRICNENILSAGGSVSAVSFSPDGKALAAVANGQIIIWDYSDRRVLHTFPNVWRTFAWSPNGQYIAGIDNRSSTVQVWRVQDEALVASLSAGIAIDYGIFNLSWSPDSTLIAASCDGGQIKIWHVLNTKLVETLRGNKEAIWSLAFSPNGSMIAADGRNGSILIWNVKQATITHTLRGPGGPLDVDFSPDGQLLVVGNLNNTIQLWRISEGKIIQTFTGHTDSVNSTIFSPDGRLIASSAGWANNSGSTIKDRSIRIWRVSDGRLLRTLKGHSSMVTSVSFSRDSQTLASGSWDGTVRLWSVK